MTQVNAYITAEEKILFEEYADRLCIDASSLLKLLIVRELRNGQHRLHDHPTKAQSKLKITAHFSERSRSQITTYDAFSKYTQKIGSTKTGAASALVSCELSERWLEKALSSDN